MKTEAWQKDEHEESYPPLKKTRRSKRHKYELKPYKREKYKYKDDVV